MKLPEPLAVCCYAVSRSGLKAGDTAVVIGGGPIGLMTAAVLQSKGVQVLVSELTEAWLNNCKRRGIACPNPEEESFKQVMIITAWAYRKEDFDEALNMISKNGSAAIS